jgi:hypothetical protein
MMKISFKVGLLVSALIFFVAPRQAEAAPAPPKVTTQSASSVTATTATLNGTITLAPSPTATVRGFAWGTNSLLSGGDTATTTWNTGSFGIGAFTDTTLTFVCNTTYYARAYATNAVGTGLGAISAPFTTSACKAKPKSIIGLPGNYLTLSSGLVGYWPFDGKTTNWATGKTNDVSGNANTGTLTGMNLATSPVAGKIGQALKFNGTSQYISIADGSGTFAPATFSISAWVKPSITLGSSQGVGLFGYNTGSTPTLDFELAASGASARWTSTGLSNTSQFYGIGSLSAGTWYLITLVYDGSFKRVYVNGVEDSHDAAAATGTLTASTLFTIGGDLHGSGGLARYFPGVIDDVRIYNRALSSSEVQALYHLGAANIAHSNTTALSSGLVGYWNFDGGTTHWNTGKVDDVSGQGNTGQLINMSTTTSPVPGKIGQALKFNGVSSCINQSNSSSLQLTTAYTMSGWVKTSGVANFARLEGVYTFNSPRDIDIDWGTNAHPELFDRDALTEALDSNTNVSDNKWHFIAATRNGNFYAIYIDGVLKNSETNSGVIGVANTHGWRIGCSGSDIAPNASFFTGSIDDVRIYNRALSASEVQELYTMGRVRL